MSKRTNQSFEDLTDSLVALLQKKMDDGTVTAAELNVARQLIESAGIRINPLPGTKAAALLQSMRLTSPIDDEVMPANTLPFPIAK